MFYSIDRMMQKVPDSIVQNGNTTKILALIQVARAMDIVELCKRGDYNQPNARYPQTKSERIVDELLSLMLQDSTVELDPALDEMLSILSSLDKGVDKPKDWQALFAIADEIETRKTNHQSHYNDKYVQ
jgi:hypothetical protein